ARIGECKEAAGGCRRRICRIQLAENIMFVRNNALLTKRKCEGIRGCRRNRIKGSKLAMERGIKKNNSPWVHGGVRKIEQKGSAYQNRTAYGRPICLVSASHT